MKPLILPDDAVHVWSFSLAVSPATLRAGGEWLTPDEKTWSQRWDSEIHRQRFVVARFGLRALLARYLNCTPAALQFAQASEGKPYLLSSDHSHLRFNISHSADRALVAVTRNREVGVDLEAVRHNLDFEGLAPIVFSPPELAAWHHLPPAARTEAFFAAWVGKEAWLKALGCGLKRPMSELALADLDLAAGLTHRRYGLAPIPGFACALVVSANSASIFQLTIDLDQLLR